MTIIEFKNITKSYAIGGSKIEVLKNINLKIKLGEFVAIMGPSGSGKSTLMQIMGLLDRPSSGTYTLLNLEVSRLSDDEGAALRSKTIGFVFQMFNLLPRTSVLDNVRLPLLYASASVDQENHVRELLNTVTLDDRVFHKSNELSGGQQQRVAIARALVNRPQILFADEPTGNLASDQAEEVLRHLQSLHRSGLTIILVTHEPEIAASAERIIRLKDGIIVSDERKKTFSRRHNQNIAVRRTLDDQSLLNPASYLSFSQWKTLGLSALRSLILHKIRSLLSMLGILIGVAAVIAMLAIGKGAEHDIEARLAALGSNVVMLFAGSPSSRGVRGAAGNLSRLTLADAKAIGAYIPQVANLYPEAEGNVRVVYQDQNCVTELQGVTPSYESIRNARPAEGRFFSEDENTSLSRVLLLGPAVAAELFGQENPVGNTVKINHINFKVIGILPTRGVGSGDQDNMIIMPIQTAMRRVLGVEYLHEMAIECSDAESISQMMSNIEDLMRRRHHLPIYKENDFTMRNNAELQASLSDTTRTMSLLLGFVSGISLLVGGIGIMNIMLVSVNERTREIGLRKAIGATRRAILIQFLIESGLLSLSGGIIGILVGAAAAVALAMFAKWSTMVTFQGIALAFIFSASIGVIFGFWPARKASLLSPIEALRYE